MKTFLKREYVEVNWDDLDQIIQEELDIPGFEAQRVYAWPNDVYLVGTTQDQDEDEALGRLLTFLSETRATIKDQVQKEWHLMMEGWEVYQATEVSEPEPYMVLDRQIENYQKQYGLPSFDAFLRALHTRQSIPEGPYLISTSR